MSFDLGRVLAIALIAAGCSDPEAPNPPGSGGSGAGGGAGAGGSLSSGGMGAVAGAGAASGTGGSAGAEVVCNDLVLEAPAWGFTYTADEAPTPMGGDITDGTYFVKEIIWFEVAPGPPLTIAHTQIEISGNTWQEVQGDADDPTLPPDRRTSAMSYSGTTGFTLTRTCPTAGDPDMAEYTADASGFTLYVTDGGERFGTVFEKQ